MTPQEIYRHIKLGMSEDQAVQLINDLIKNLSLIHI